MAIATAAQELTQRGRERRQRAEGLLGQLESTRPPFTRQNVLDRLNDLWLELSNVDSEASLLAEVHPELAVREAAEALAQEAERFRTTLLQSRPLYDALGGIDPASLDDLARRVVTLAQRDMRRSGVALGDEERERVRKLRDELVLIEQEFARNIREDVRSIELSGPDELEGLPADYVRAHGPGPDGKIRITTDYPDAIPFMAYAKSEPARRALSFASQNRAVPRNLEVLANMLAKRHELAQLLGYPHWAEYAAEDKMTGSAQNVRDFIERARVATRESARSEIAELVAMKRRDDPSARAVGTWEHAYYTERVKAERLNFDSRAVRPYFEYRAVKQAILDLNSRLFSLTFTPVAFEESWHPAVETFTVTVDGKPMGRISLDMHPREGKFKHAACFTWRPGVGGKQLPHGVLVCNFPDPATQPGPALMTHQEVVTLFHEFGHLVHGIVSGEIPWVRLGRVTEWDFIEAPSQFLEEWIFDFEVLRRFARHVETGETIPAELVERLREARDFARAVRVQQQLFYAVVSLSYHDRDPRGIETTKAVFDLAKDYSPFELLDGTHFQASFGHLEGYTSNYYTYMWSLVLAKDLHTAFANGLMDLAQARRYRDLVLAPGGTKPAGELVRDFLGRPFSFDAFRRWLAPEERRAA